MASGPVYTDNRMLVFFVAFTDALKATLPPTVNDITPFTDVLSSVSERDAQLHK